MVINCYSYYQCFSFDILSSRYHEDRNSTPNQFLDVFYPPTLLISCFGSNYYAMKVCDEIFQLIYCIGLSCVNRCLATFFHVRVAKYILRVCWKEQNSIFNIFLIWGIWMIICDEEGMYVMPSREVSVVCNCFSAICFHLENMWI